MTRSETVRGLVAALRADPFAPDLLRVLSDAVRDEGDDATADALLGPDLERSLQAMADLGVLPLPPGTWQKPLPLTTQRPPAFDDFRINFKVFCQFAPPPRYQPGVILHGTYS